MQECGADALDNRVEFGVWGGMTERQRRVTGAADRPLFVITVLLRPIPGRSAGGCPVRRDLVGQRAQRFQVRNIKRQ